MKVEYEFSGVDANGTRIYGEGMCVMVEGFELKYYLLTGGEFVEVKDPYTMFKKYSTEIIDLR